MSKYGEIFSGYNRTITIIIIWIGAPIKVIIACIFPLFAVNNLDI